MILFIWCDCVQTSFTKSHLKNRSLIHIIPHHMNVPSVVINPQKDSPYTCFQSYPFLTELPRHVLVAGGLT